MVGSALEREAWLGYSTEEALDLRRHWKGTRSRTGSGLIISFTQERAVRIGSTSNDAQTTAHGADAMPDDSPFDLDQGLANVELQRDALQFYEHLEDPECNDPLSRSTVAASRVTATDLFQNVSGNEEFVSKISVPMQLLNLAEQERADLLMVHPKAKVKGDCITTTDFIFVVKRFLFDVTLHGILGVRHPDAYARLLRRLSLVLRSWLFDLDSLLDPADYVECLDVMLKDIEETWEKLKRDSKTLKALDEIWGPDGCVYVRRGTDAYVHCLLAALTALNIP